MRQLHARNIFFPYWWLAWALQRQNPSHYVISRNALKTAAFTAGRTTSAASNTVDPDKCVEWLYGLLTVLDAKASALMRLNGVVLAGATVLLGFLGGPGAFSLINVSSGIVLLIAVLSSISIALCLLVVSVDWSFMGLVQRTEGKLDFTDEIDHLECVSRFRQFVYRFAWVISFVAAILFAFIFLTQLFAVCT